MYKPIGVQTYRWVDTFWVAWSISKSRFGLFLLSLSIRRIQDDYGTSDLFDPREADEILGFGEDGLAVPGRLSAAFFAQAFNFLKPLCPETLFGQTNRSNRSASHRLDANEIERQPLHRKMCGRQIDQKVIPGRLIHGGNQSRRLTREEFVPPE